MENKEILEEIKRIRKNVVFFFWWSLANVIIGGVFGSAIAVATLAAA